MAQLSATPSDRRLDGRLVQYRQCAKPPQTMQTRVFRRIRVPGRAAAVHLGIREQLAWTSSPMTVS